MKIIQLFYDDAITLPALKKEQGRVAVQWAEVGGANGVVNYLDHTVKVRMDMDDAAQGKR
jgi:hypothetical protein